MERGRPVLLAESGGHRLYELEAFTDGPLGSFRDLPGGAKPPWRWVDRRRVMGAGPGAIVLAPDGFCQAIRRLTRP